MTMNKPQQIKAIREAYAELSLLDLQDGFREVHRYLLDKNLAAERQHRKGAPYGIRHGLGVKDAAKLFVCTHLLEGFARPDKWSADDILNIRTEVLYAQAYAKRFHDKLTAWATKWSPLFLHGPTGEQPIDYAELMKGE